MMKSLHCQYNIMLIPERCNIHIESQYIYGLNETNYYSEKEFEDGIRIGSPVIFHCSDPVGGKPWEEGNHNVFGPIWDYYYFNSMWSSLYPKIKYDPGCLAKLQWAVYKLFPKKLYIFILRYSSEYAMRKIVKKYMKYRKDAY